MRYLYNYLLWPVRGQKEGTEVDRISVLNKQNIYIKYVLVQQVEASVRNCQVWLLGGSLPKNK